MSIARVNTDYLTGAADAIRRKIGSQNPIPLTQFEDEIDNIPTTTLMTKTITENGVYNAISDNADGYDVVTVDVPQDPNENFDKFMNDTLEHYSTTATIIPLRCFENKANMLSINMPNVTTIGSNAFRSCTNLLNIIMPNVTNIEPVAFQGCTNLALTSLPSGITAINDYTFQYCANLALTSLPSGVTTIGILAFRECTSLALTSLPNSIVNIAANSFQRCISIPFLDFSEFTNIPVLGTNAFLNTQFPFYFRDQQQLDEWAAATNWSTYANRFQIKPSGVI